MNHSTLNPISKFIIIIISIIAVVGSISYCLDALYQLERAYRVNCETANIPLPGSMVTEQYVLKDNQKFPIKVYFNKISIDNSLENPDAAVPYFKIAHYGQSVKFFLTSAILLLFYFIVKIKKQDQIFTRKRMKLIQIMGFVIILSSVFDYGYALWITNDIMPNLIGEGNCLFKGNAPGEQYLGMLPFPKIFTGKFIVGAGIIALAEVFKSGISLQEEQKLVI